MRRLFTLFVLFLGINAAYGQDVAPVTADSTLAPKDTSNWYSQFSIGFNFNQAAFSGNWKAGGVNSLAFGSILDWRLKYAKNRWSWDSQLELIYGLVKNDGQEQFRKSNDRIFYDTKLGYKISKHWGYFAGVNFISQFTDGFDFTDNANPKLISRFFAPAFLTTGFGFEYKPNNDFALRLAPFSPRFTFVTDTTLINNVPTNYGVARGETLRTEWLAFQIFATYNKKFNDNLTLNSRYQLFANLQEFSFEKVDHRLDVTVIAKITKYVDVTFTSINVYDIDMTEGIQFSQALALGIVYKTRSKK